MSEKEHIKTDEARFVITERARQADVNDRWYELLKETYAEVDQQADEIEELRAQLDRPHMQRSTADAIAPELSTRQQRQLLHARVLERFNRAHGQNPKIKLEDICAEMGDSYEAVRKYRSRKGKGKNRK